MKNDGLIMMGDLPKWKMMVSLWWVTYPNGRWKKFEVVSLLWVTYPIKKKCEVVSLLWVTYPNESGGLIMMGDLPRWRCWSHYDGWPTQIKDVGLIMTGDLPKERWSHYDGWPTQMEDDGLIMMGDLPKCKMVSLWWVTYPVEMMVSLWWVTYPNARQKTVSL